MQNCKPAIRFREPEVWLNESSESRTPVEPGWASERRIKEKYPGRNGGRGRRKIGRKERGEGYEEGG